MPQSQNIVPLFRVGLPQGSAVATGNNAAWHCRCAYPNPLVGRTGCISGPTPRFEIQCPNCRQRYFVVPASRNFGSALRVEEI